MLNSVAIGRLRRPAALAAVDQPQQRAAVHDPASTRLGAGLGPRPLDQGRDEVDVRGRRVDLDPGLTLAAEGGRDPDHERHVRGLLVGESLAGREPMLAVEVAVVGGEDDHRLVELAGGAQRLDELGDPTIDRRQCLEPALVPGPDPRSLGGVQRPLLGDEVGLVGDVALEHRRQVRQRRLGEATLVAPGRDRSAATGTAAVGVQVLVVGRRLPELEEERPRPRELADQLRGAIVEHVGQIATAVVDLLALAPVDGELEVVVTARVADQRRPAVPAGATSSLSST